MQALHDGLPDGGGFLTARCAAIERLKLIVTDPDRAAVIRRQARKEHALVVGVRAGLARNRHALDACGGTGAAVDRVGEHISRAGLEGLALALRLLKLHVENHVAVCVRDAGKGQRLLVDAAVADGAEGFRHFGHSDAGGAERKARTVGVDVVGVNAQLFQIGDAVFDAHLVHQRVCRDDVERGAHTGAQRHHAGIFF